MRLAESGRRGRAGSASSRRSQRRHKHVCEHGSSWRFWAGRGLGGEFTQQSHALAGHWHGQRCHGAASSRTRCQGELSQPSVPGKARRAIRSNTNAALLPVLSQGPGNFHLKHKNILKPRYAQAISGEDGCKESHKWPSGIKPWLKMYTEALPWLCGFEVKVGKFSQYNNASQRGKLKPTRSLCHTATTLEVSDPAGISFTPTRGNTKGHSHSLI